MFQWRNKKIINISWLKQVLYLEQRVPARMTFYSHTGGTLLLHKGKEIRDMFCIEVSLIINLSSHDSPRVCERL